MGVYWVRVFPGGVFGGSVTPKRWIVGVWGHERREGRSALEVLRRPHARSLPRAGHRRPRELPTAGGGALAKFSLTCAWRRRRGSPRSWDSSRDATRTWRRQRSLPRNMVTPTHQRETYSQSLSAEFLMESSPPSSVVQTFGVLGGSGNTKTNASRALRQWVLILH